MLTEILHEIKKEFTTGTSTLEDALKEAYQAGAEAEREACACICDVRADNGDDSAYLLAAEIRERGTT